MDNRPRNSRRKPMAAVVGQVRQSSAAAAGAATWNAGCFFMNFLKNPKTYFERVINRPSRGVCAGSRQWTREPRVSVGWRT